MYIRDYHPGDRDALVALSLRPWAPVFDSMPTTIGSELAARLHGHDWRPHQARSVSETLAAAGNRSWVAEVDGGRAGFAVAAIADRTRCIGEIVMLAVDPVDQRQGVGHALNEHATAWLFHAGMRVAMVETGGDPGHAPARRLYERAGYRLTPIARYFKPL